MSHQVPSESVSPITEKDMPEIAPHVTLRPPGVQSPPSEAMVLVSSRMNISPQETQAAIRSLNYSQDGEYTAYSPDSFEAVTAPTTPTYQPEETVPTVQAPIALPPPQVVNVPFTPKPVLVPKANFKTNTLPSASVPPYVPGAVVPITETTYVPTDALPLLGNAEIGKVLEDALEASFLNDIEEVDMDMSLFDNVDVGKKPKKLVKKKSTVPTTKKPRAPPKKKSTEPKTEPKPKKPAAPRTRKPKAKKEVNVEPVIEKAVVANTSPLGPETVAKIATDMSPETVAKIAAALQSSSLDQVTTASEALDQISDDMGHMLTDMKTVVEDTRKKHPKLKIARSPGKSISKMREVREASSSSSSSSSGSEYDSDESESNEETTAAFAQFFGIEKSQEIDPTNKIAKWVQAGTSKKYSKALDQTASRKRRAAPPKRVSKKSRSSSMESLHTIVSQKTKKRIEAQRTADIPAQVKTPTPIPTPAPVELPTETPIEVPTETPIEVPAQVETPAQVEAPAPVETPAPKPKRKTDIAPNTFTYARKNRRVGCKDDVHPDLLKLYGLETVEEVVPRERSFELDTSKNFEEAYVDFENTVFDANEHERAKNEIQHSLDHVSDYLSEVNGFNSLGSFLYNETIPKLTKYNSLRGLGVPKRFLPYIEHFLDELENDHDRCFFTLATICNYLYKELGHNNLRVTFETDEM